MAKISAIYQLEGGLGQIGTVTYMNELDTIRVGYRTMTNLARMTEADAKNHNQATKEKAHDEVSNVSVLVWNQVLMCRTVVDHCGVSRRDKRR